jgi:hypothetical protein
MLAPDCQYGDHTWRGGSVCVRCGERLRCYCGQFVREDELDVHLETCRWGYNGQYASSREDE